MFFCSLNTSKIFILDISKSSSLINSSTETLNISANFFNDSILGSNVPDSYFEIVAGFTPNDYAISTCVMSLLSLYNFIFSPNINKNSPFHYNIISYYF